MFRLYRWRNRLWGRSLPEAVKRGRVPVAATVDWTDVFAAAMPDQSPMNFPRQQAAPISHPLFLAKTPD